MDWFLYGNGLRHERVNINGQLQISGQLQNNSVNSAMSINIDRVIKSLILSLHQLTSNKEHDKSNTSKCLKYSEVKCNELPKRLFNTSQKSS